MNQRMYYEINLSFDNNLPRIQSLISRFSTQKLQLRSKRITYLASVQNTESTNVCYKDVRPSFVFI
jgi:hypothetical protein